MDDERRPNLLEQPQHLGAVADVAVVVDEMPRGRAQPLEVRRRVSRLAEELTAHVVVDSVDAPPAGVEVLDHLGADQAARAGDDSSLPTHPASVNGYRQSP